MFKDKKIWECLSFIEKSQSEIASPTVSLTPIQRDNLELLIQQAHDLWKRGRRDKAIVAFQEAAAIDANYVRDWLERTKERYLNLLQCASTISTYNRVLDAAPVRLRAWSRFQSGQFSPQERCKQALASYDQLLKVQPNNHLAWYYRGDALLELKRYSEAIASYKRAVEIEPRGKGGWSMRVRKLLRTQCTTEATELCRHVASSLKPKLSPRDCLSSLLREEFRESWQQLGSYLYQLEQYSEAAGAYQQAIAFKPDDVESWLARAEVLEHLQCYSEALFCYHQVLHLQPDNPGAIAACQHLQSR